MSHLRMAEKHQHILLKNVEARPTRKIHVAEAPRRPPRDFRCQQPFKPLRYVSRETSHRPHPLPKHHMRGLCHKCGRKEHFAKECKTPAYFVEIYKELQKLRGVQRETHALDAPSLFELDAENYMVLSDEPSTGIEVALLIVRPLIPFSTI